MRIYYDAVYSTKDAFGEMSFGQDYSWVTNAPLGQTFVPEVDRADVIEIMLNDSQANRPTLGEQQVVRVDLRIGGVGGQLVASTAPVVLTYQGIVDRFPQQFHFMTPAPIV
jgi:hypothetical protein